MSQANQKRGHLPGGVVARGISNILHAVTFYFGKKSPTFSAKVGGPEIERPVAPPPVFIARILTNPKCSYTVS